MNTANRNLWKLRNFLRTHIRFWTNKAVPSCRLWRQCKRHGRLEGTLVVHPPPCPLSLNCHLLPLHHLSLPLHRQQQILLRRGMLPKGDNAVLSTREGERLLRFTSSVLLSEAFWNLSARGTRWAKRTVGHEIWVRSTGTKSTSKLWPTCERSLPRLTGASISVLNLIDGGPPTCMDVFFCQYSFRLTDTD